MVLAGIIAFFYFILFVPNLDKIKKLEAERVTLEADVKKAQEAVNNLEHHQKELEKAEKRFEEISIVLPKQKEIPKLLRNISDRGTSAGLDFKSFEPGDGTPKDFYAAIPIAIAVRGPYHNVGYFLDQVSKLDRIVTVDNINMENPAEEEGEILLDSTCNLLTYRFTNKQAAVPEKDGKKSKK